MLTKFPGPGQSTADVKWLDQKLAQFFEKGSIDDVEPGYVSATEPVTAEVKLLLRTAEAT